MSFGQTGGLSGEQVVGRERRLAEAAQEPVKRVLCAYADGVGIGEVDDAVHGADQTFCDESGPVAGLGSLGQAECAAQQRPVAAEGPGRGRWARSALKTGDADRDRGNQQVAVADPGIEVLQVHRHAQPARGRQQVSECAIGDPRTAASRVGPASPSRARLALAQVLL